MQKITFLKISYIFLKTLLLYLVQFGENVKRSFMFVNFL